MDKYILLLDIGGTNTRARILKYNENRFMQFEVIGTRSSVLSNRDRFFDFVDSLVNEFDLAGKPGFCVLCCAGPVLRHRSVVITNWQTPNTLDVQMLAQHGLPESSTVLLNDMEAAAYRLVAGQEFSATAMTATTLYSPADASQAGNNNAVLIMPGTGVGVAAIHADTDPASRLPVVIPCEMQHSPIPALDEDHAVLIRAMAQRLQKLRPSWEDFISGRGLVNIDALLRNNVEESATALNAVQIAERALNRTDPICVQTMHWYYRCIGGLAQVLALTIQPAGGIFLAGTTTYNNHAFIVDSIIVEELQNNVTHASLLKRFPVYLLLEELNLEGAAYVAQRCMQEDSTLLKVLRN